MGSGHETTRELDSMPKPHPLNVPRHDNLVSFRFVSFPGSIPGFITCPSLFCGGRDFLAQGAYFVVVRMDFITSEPQVLRKTLGI